MLDSATNTTIEELAHALLGYESFAITGHVNPDGDCLGSQLALASALKSLGKRVDVLLVEDAAVEHGLRFLPGFSDLVPAEHYAGTPDAFVSVDVSSLNRIGASAEVMKRAKCRFIIDHHASPTFTADYLYDDPDTAATTMLVWDVAKSMGAPLNADLATCAYTGLMTDTGRFQFQNTDPAAFEYAAEMVAAGARPAYIAQEFYQSRSIASLRLEERLISRMEILHEGRFALSHLTLDDYAEFGATSADSEGLVDTLRKIRGSEVACIVKERERFIRGSIRTKRDDIDVSAIARALGGGGHKAAAGFTMEIPLEQALEAVREQIDALFPEA